MEKLPRDIKRLVVAYYGIDTFSYEIKTIIKKYEEGQTTSTIQEWELLWEVFNLQNKDFANLVDLKDVYIAFGFDTLKCIYAKFDFETRQIQEKLLGYPEHKYCYPIYPGILYKAFQRGDCRTIHWLISIEAITLSTQVFLKIDDMITMYHQRGIYGLQLYIDVVRPNLQILDESPKNTFLTAILKQANLRDIIWCYEQLVIPASADYVNSLLVRRIYRVHGIDRLINLCQDRRFKITLDNIMSGDNEITRRAIKNGDFFGLKWIFDNFIQFQENWDCVKYRLYKYAHCISIKKGHYKIIRLFIDYFGEPAGPVNWRRVNAYSQIYTPIMEECISQLISLKFPSCIVDIISQYIKQY